MFSFKFMSRKLKVDTRSISDPSIANSRTSPWVGLFIEWERAHLIFSPFSDNFFTANQLCPLGNSLFKSICVGEQTE